jgi:peptidoglycan/LPS O-acetylase OafA/YrhL
VKEFRYRLLYVISHLSFLGLIIGSAILMVILYDAPTYLRFGSFLIGIYYGTLLILAKTLGLAWEGFVEEEIDIRPKEKESDKVKELVRQKSDHPKNLILFGLGLFIVALIFYLGGIFFFPTGLLLLSIFALIYVIVGGSSIIGGLILHYKKELEHKKCLQTEDNL